MKLLNLLRKVSSERIFYVGLSVFPPFIFLLWEKSVRELMLDLNVIGV